MPGGNDPETLQKLVDAMNAEQLQNCLASLEEGALDGESSFEERLRIRALFQRKLDSFRMGRRGLIAVRLPPEAGDGAP